MSLSKKYLNADFLELVLRIWTAFFVFVYGAGKAIQFSKATTNATPINEASSFEIMWAFFGVTQVYPILIAAFQVIGAFMLLFRKTKLLAALLLTPVFFNIIILDILYKIPQGALLNAILFQLVFLYVLYRERQVVVMVFKKLLLDDATDGKKQRIEYFVIASLVAAAIFFCYTYLV